MLINNFRWRKLGSLFDKPKEVHSKSLSEFVVRKGWVF